MSLHDGILSSTHAGLVDALPPLLVRLEAIHDSDSSPRCDVDQHHIMTPPIHSSSSCLVKNLDPQPPTNPSFLAQGSLAALKSPHVVIADSLAMGEAAAKMAGTGEVDAIICMGVDFMAESVRATLDSNNHQVGVAGL